MGVSQHGEPLPTHIFFIFCAFPSTQTSGMHYCCLFYSGFHLPRALFQSILCILCVNQNLNANNQNKHKNKQTHVAHETNPHNPTCLLILLGQDPSRNIGKTAHKWPWIQKAFSTAAAALIHGPYGWVPLEPVGLKVSYPSLKAAWDAVRNSVTAQVRQLEHGKRNKSGGKFAMENRGLSESTRKGKTKSGKQKGHNDRKSGQALHHVNQGGTSKKAAKRRRKKATKQRVLRA